MDTYLSPSRFIDSDHPAVVEFAENIAARARIYVTRQSVFITPCVRRFATTLTPSAATQAL